MAIDVTATIEVARPRAEVAAFLEDPANDLRWIRALTSSERLGAGPTGTGLRVRRVAKVMGRSMPYTTEIVGYEPARALEMETVDGPFPMHVTYRFADTAAGTSVSVRNRGGKGLMFAVFGPFTGWMVNSRVKGDLRALKRALEAEAHGESRS
jgi:carbon monoxide dehydrogenase subunit G